MSCAGSLGFYSISHFLLLLPTLVEKKKEVKDNHPGFLRYDNDLPNTLQSLNDDRR
jgi:hypothetical protein